MNAALSREHKANLVSWFQKTKYSRSDRMPSGIVGYKKTMTSMLRCSLTLLLSLWEKPACHAVRLPWKEGSQLSCHDDTQAAYEIPYRASKWGLQAAMWVSLEMNLLGLSLETTAPQWMLGCTQFRCYLFRELEPEPLSHAAYRLPTHRTYEIINVCCFKQLNLGYFVIPQ